MIASMSREIKIYDTTLRDGTQGEGVAFSMEDKVRIAQRLDALGVHYIEGGWPGSNPKDLRFFKRVQDAVFKTARITAFGATRRPGVRPQEDANLKALVEAGPPVVTIFGKSWDFHVTSAISTTLEENLAMIGDSVAYLLKHFEEVIYDAEHFFDGFKRNPDYALRTLLAAEAAGAHCLVLCDTNGGSLPHEIGGIIREVKRVVKPGTPLGIHAHNDVECGVANSLVAVGEGVNHVQGTINGYGERCGNANLVSIIPNVMVKMGLACIPRPNLRELRDVSRFVSELANRKPWQSQPYVGDSAFAHKGGIHVSAVLKHPETYEHMDPELVGNHRRVLVSELAGQSNILWKGREYGIDLDKTTGRTSTSTATASSSRRTTGTRSRWRRRPFASRSSPSPSTRPPPGTVPSTRWITRSGRRSRNSIPTSRRCRFSTTRCASSTSPRGPAPRHAC